jgi:peptidoglycan hydrolase FlgJ
MTIPPVQNRTEAADIPLDRLAGNSQFSDEQKIAEAARQFEAMLVRQILEGANRSVVQSSYTDESTTSGIYRDMVNNQLADSISRSGAMGLAQILNREFTKQLQSESKAADEKPAEPAIESAAQLKTFLNPTKTAKEIRVNS